MTETSFRITEKQLHNLGSQLAAKAEDYLLVGICGSGKAQFSEHLTRESWSFQEVVAEVQGTDLWTFPFKEGKKYCIISSSMDALAVVSRFLPDCLWIHCSNCAVHAYRYDGSFKQITTCLTVGHDLVYSFDGSDSGDIGSERHQRTNQAFGKGTTTYLSKLTVGIAGASGTGSIIAEQLYRLGVKRIVLVDDDYVEVRNLGRILNSSIQDAQNHVLKVDMLKAAYDSMGLGTEIYALPTAIATPDTVRMLSQCDLLFGCLDSADGRMHLNRISTFYTVPYIDMGVKLKSDKGLISEISCSVRYIKPDGASLFSLGVYSSKQLVSESLRRDDPVEYRARLDEKYIQGAHEDSPAVISVNMTAASMAIQEFLNRIHRFRDTPNSAVEVISQNLLEPCILPSDPPASADPTMKKYLGKGDCIPLLDIPRIGV